LPIAKRLERRTRMAYRINATCPHCHSACQLAECFGDERAGRPPRPGDPNVCFRCAEVATFDVSREPGGESLVLRLPTTAELDRFRTIDVIESTRAALLLFRLFHPAEPEAPPRGET
jgi:hypothetical protein